MPFFYHVAYICPDLIDPFVSKVRLVANNWVKVDVFRINSLDNFGVDTFAYSIHCFTDKRKNNEV